MCLVATLLQNIVDEHRVEVALHHVFRIETVRLVEDVLLEFVLGHRDLGEQLELLLVTHHQLHKLLSNELVLTLLHDGLDYQTFLRGLVDRQNLVVELFDKFDDWVIRVEDVTRNEDVDWLFIKVDLQDVPTDQFRLNFEVKLRLLLTICE